MDTFSINNAILIDDSDIDLFIQRRFLEVYGFAKELTLFKSAEEGLEWLKTTGLTSPPDLIFLDLNMPRMDGFGFLNAFAHLPEAIKNKSKIVVLTSSNSSKDRQQAMFCEQVIEFFTKPLKQTDLEELKKRYISA